MNELHTGGLKYLFRKLIKDENGNFAVVFAVAAPVLLAFVGGTFTLQDLQSRHQTLQKHADIISLAAVRQRAVDGNKRREIKDYRDLYSNTELKDDEKCWINLKEKPNNNKERRTTITINCTGKMKSLFSHFVGQDYLHYAVSSTSTMRTPQDVELTFVFDVSESMKGAEISELKNGLRALVDSKISAGGKSQISLIPFSNTVRLGNRFETQVNRQSGYDATNGKYTGCFDRNITEPDANIKRKRSYNLVTELRENSARRHCPEAEMEALFHVEASSFAVRNMIENISVSFGTGSADALVWGYRSLDSKYRHVLSGTNSSKNSRSKHLIFMTDGKPLDVPFVEDSSMTQDERREQSLNRFVDYCDRLPFDRKKINVHIINYNNHLDTKDRKAMEKCVKGEGLFYDIKGNDLSKTLKLITDDIENLRLQY